MNDSAVASVARVEDGFFLPEGAGLFTRLRLAIRCLTLLKDHPTDVIAGPLVNASLDMTVYQRLAADFRASADGLELLTARPELQGKNLGLPRLAQLPDGTLGREVARYFETNGIFPFETPVAPKNDVEYLSKRYRETHDVVHVLTGYGTDVPGEMEVQAFMVGNQGIPSGLLILFFAVVTNQHKLPLRTFFRRVRAAWRRGKAAKLLLRTRFEHLWETPVADVRAQLGVV